MAKGIHFITVVLSLTFVQTVVAQTPSKSPTAATPIGTWRGTSTCLVRPSPCNDEIVIYRITPMKAADSAAMDARKIVRGEEQEMGVLDCQLLRQSGQLTCKLPRGTWQFRAYADSLTGELLLPDNTRFREVRAIRVK
ncbi:MAG TPA: hypothetical protein VM099_01305 [Gemmatimonadaceae bacterium]|nr:hypothetical protein [Gemmatimonadaceae bacterium]